MANPAPGGRPGAVPAQAPATPAQGQPAAAGPGTPVNVTHVAAPPQGAPAAQMSATPAAAQASTSVPANPAAMQAATAASLAAAGATSASAPGNSQATAPAAAVVAQQAVPASQSPSEARGNTVLPGADRAQPRADGPLPHGHTVESAQRRRTMRGLGMAMLAAARGHGPASEPELRRQADHVFHWLYWALTITAWLCLGLLILAVTPMFAPAGGTPARGTLPLGLVALLGGIGLCAGVIAWRVSRRRR